MGDRHAALLNVRRAVYNDILSRPQAFVNDLTDTLPGTSKWYPGRIMMKKGQRYIQKLQFGSQGTIWEVAAVLPDKTHARLFKVSDRFDFKTLSCSMLDGKHDFSIADRVERA